MEPNTLNLILDEIEYLKKSHTLLQELSTHLSPYDYQINGNDSGSLARRVHEHVNTFNDNE